MNKEEPENLLESPVKFLPNTDLLKPLDLACKFQKFP